MESEKPQLDIFQNVNSSGLVWSVEFYFSKCFVNPPVQDSFEIKDDEELDELLPEGELHDLVGGLFGDPESDPLCVTIRALDEDWPWQGGTSLKVMCHLLGDEEITRRVRQFLEGRYRLRDVNALRQDQYEELDLAMEGFEKEASLLSWPESMWPWK